MRKIFTVMIILTLIFWMSLQADASTNKVTITTYNSSTTYTGYVKSTDNKATKYVTLEFQKDGKTIKKEKVTVKKNQQLKKQYKMTSKGKYRIKYTVSGKYSYSSIYKK